MNLYDLLGDWLLDLPIVEQASRRAEIESKITALGEQIVRHLIKIYKWDDPINVNHHINDVSSWFEAIDNKKIKGGKLKAKVYYQWILTDNVSGVSDITKQVMRLKSDYGHIPVVRSDVEVYEAICDIVSRISIDMANNTFIKAHSYF
jgi:hypothetical protein